MLGYRATVHLSVVIPALDEATEVQAAVRSAAVPGVEVLVVDGGSRDETAERARAAGAVVIAAARGRAHQLAAGIAATHGDAIVMLHADSRLPAGWAESVRAALGLPGVVAGAFAFRFARGEQGGIGIRLRFIESGVRLRLALFRLPYGDQGIFCRRTALDAAGGVPQVDFMEDLDLVHALRRQGRLVLLRSAVETSPRRYDVHGPLRSMLRNWGAALAWTAGIDRARVAAWYRR